MGFYPLSNCVMRDTNFIIIILKFNLKTLCAKNGLQINSETLKQSKLSSLESEGTTLLLVTHIQPNALWCPVHELVDTGVVALSGARQ